MDMAPNGHGECVPTSREAAILVMEILESVRVGLDID